MANINSPHGCFPLGINLAGGAPTIEEFTKVVGDGQAIFRYDPVARVAGGAISAASISPGTTLYSGVALDYGALSTATTHKVITSPDALYEAQGDSTGVAAANLGLNANLALNAGDATTKKSGAVINHVGIAVDATLDVHLLRLFANADNVAGAYARVEIVFNKHRMAPASVGV